MPALDIRVELPNEALWDFTVSAEYRDEADGRRTPAFRVARQAAGDRIREQHGQDAQIEWRGMVAFVNRPVPLDPK